MPAAGYRIRSLTATLAASVLTFTGCTTSAAHKADSATGRLGPSRTTDEATAAATESPGTSTSTSTSPGATSHGNAVAAPARAYVEAVNAGDLNALVQSFAPTGRVNDVNRPIIGQAAIRTWAANEVIGGHLVVLSVTTMPGGQDLLVHWAPRGSTGWRAHYRFTMNDEHITIADLQYA